MRRRSRSGTWPWDHLRAGIALTGTVGGHPDAGGALYGSVRPRTLAGGRKRPRLEGGGRPVASVGISLGDPGTPVGNTFEEDHIRRNVCGGKGSTTGNGVGDNKRTDNGTDVCPRSSRAKRSLRA